MPLCGILRGVSGWVRRGGNPRTPSGPRGSSGKEVNLGAAGLPARAFYLNQNTALPAEINCLTVIMGVSGRPGLRCLGRFFCWDHVNLIVIRGGW